MRSALPLALLAATGCDLVYGLNDRKEPDAGPELDALDALEIDSSIPCTMYSDTVVAVNDTMLLHDAGGECNPSIRLGTYINVNLGQASAATRSRVLLRFTLSPEMLAALQPAGGFTEATLTLPLKPMACNGPCASTALDFAIHAANNDWHEGQAAGNVGTGWCMRKQLTPSTPVLWEMRGANGATDRSTMALGNFSITQAQAMGDQLVVTTTPVAAVLEDARTWVAGSQLSLLLIPTTQTGPLFIKAREDVANGGGARLTIKSCR